MAEEEDFDWDADDFDPDAGFSNKEWADEDAELKKEMAAATAKTTPPPQPTTVVKKSKQERIEEKKAQRRAEELLIADKSTQEITLTPEQALAEKLRLQQVQKDADLQVTKELFGVSSSSNSIDNMVPSTAEEFDEFQQLLKTKLLSLASSPHYVNFMDNLIRNACSGLDPEDLRKMSSILSHMASEKTKAAKNTTKSKKKSGVKGSLAMGKASKRADLSAFGDYDDDSRDLGTEEDGYDFM